jgi:hypothetical protein
MWYLANGKTSGTFRGVLLWMDGKWQVTSFSYRVLEWIMADNVNFLQLDDGSFDRRV